MSDHVERMKAEQIDLSDRIDKLSAFIEGEIYPTLDNERRTLMVLQRDAMISYRNVLQQRLDLETSEADGDRPAAA